MKIKTSGLLVALFFTLSAAGVGYGQIKRGLQTEWRSEQLTEKLKLFEPRFQHQPVTARVVLQDRDNWFKGFTLEITNVSDKPVYAVHYFLIIPELVRPPDRPHGLPLKYGNPQLVGEKVMAHPGDASIKPGEKAVLQIPAQQYETFAKIFSELGISPGDVTKIGLHTKYVNFGDGTSWQPIYREKSLPSPLASRD